MTLTSPTPPDEQELSEAMARIIDPKAWAFQDLGRTKTPDGSFMPGWEIFLGDSLAKADAILALTRLASLRAEVARYREALEGIPDDRELRITQAVPTIAGIDREVIVLAFDGIRALRALASDPNTKEG